MPLPVAEFRFDGLRIQGTSLAGEESFIVVPELNLGFDVGRSPREVIAVDHVFLTHGHMDHSAGIAYYFAQRMFMDNDPGHLYLPQGLLPPVRELLRVWGEIDGHEPPANLHEVTPGADVFVRRDLVVRPFQVNHPCRRNHRGVIEGLGYAAIEVRRKLKEEYHALAGPQLVELKKKGVEITKTIELPLVAYCGDTAPGDFLDLDYVKNAKVLLLECTFIEPEHMERARAGYHFHLTHLREVLPRLNNPRIVLTHLSRRSVFSEALRLLSKELGSEAEERVTFLMDSRHRRRRGMRHESAASSSQETDL